MEDISREQLARRIEKAMHGRPKLSKMDWRTIYLALSRERRRIAKLIKAVEIALDSITEPEMNQFSSKLRGEHEHVEKIMDRIGQDGRSMLMELGQFTVRRDDQSEPSTGVAE